MRVSWELWKNRISSAYGGPAADACLSDNTATAATEYTASGVDLFALNWISQFQRLNSHVAAVPFEALRVPLQAGTEAIGKIHRPVITEIIEADLRLLGKRAGSALVGRDGASAR